MKKTLLTKLMLLLCALVVESSSVWATKVTLVSGSGTSGYTVPTGWSSSGTVEGGSYLKFDNGTLTSPAFAPHNSLSFAYTVATFGSGTDHPLTIRILNASTDAVILEKTTATPTSSTYISTDSPIDLGDIDVNFKIQLYAPTGKGVRLRNYSVTGTPAGGDPSSAVEFENTTPTLDLKDASSFTQAATTASGYSETTGASLTYSIGATNTASASIDAATGEVTPTQAGSVVVEVAAAAIDGHFTASYASYTLTVTDTRVWEVTYHVGNNISVANRTSGTTLSLEEPTSINGMPFVGWSSSDNVSAPAWVDNSTTVKANIELYAIFEAVAGEYSYHLVEADQDDWRGDYLIAYSATAFANGKVKGTSGIGATSTVQNPGDNLDGKIVDGTWGNNYYITLEAIDNSDLTKGYLLKTQDGYYNYQTSDANGIGGTSNYKLTASNYPISVNYTSSAQIDLTLDKGQVFRYNTSEKYFRFYKSTSYSSQGKVYLYKKTEDVAPVYSLGLTAAIAINVACTDGEGNYYGTYSNSYAFIVPDGLTVSAIGVEDNKLVLKDYSTGDIVKGNTGVMVSATSAGDKTVVLSAETGIEKDGNLLKASGNAGIDAATMNVADTKFYRLTMHNGTTIGFWWGAADGAAFALGANKAYLAVPESALAPGLDFLWFDFNGETTGMNDVRSRMSDVRGDFFDLQGRKVANPTKGLYIVNGRKVAIK